MWHVTRDMWHVTCDTWHMTPTQPLHTHTHPTPIFGGMWRRPLQWKERSSSQGTHIHTDRQTDIATLWLNRPKGRFSENKVVVCQVVRHWWSLYPTNTTRNPTAGYPASVEALQETSGMEISRNWSERRIVIFQETGSDLFLNLFYTWHL